jgi:quinohemoprotein ethanol dehydrogenase
LIDCNIEQSHAPCAGGPIRSTSRLVVIVASLLLLLAPRSSDAADGGSPRTAWVDGDRIAVADAQPGAWLTYGRSYDEQRFSPLTQIDRSNVAELGLAFSYATNTRRGMEATPLVVDGTL